MYQKVDTILRAMYQNVDTILRAVYQKVDTILRAMYQKVVTALRAVNQKVYPSAVIRYDFRNLSIRSSSRIGCLEVRFLRKLFGK